MSLSPALAQWRKTERAALIARRLAASAVDHADWSGRIEHSLRAGFPLLERLVVGFCWPYQGEFDARTVVSELHRRGARAALPVVVGKGLPLEFREWWPGVGMVNGAYDVPIPDGTPALTPDVLLIPAVGVGNRGDRLGYGGGFFDRTLAALSPRPLTLALAFELSRIPTSDPQPHDILMDFVVTECGIEAAVPGGLEAVDVAEAARRAEALLLQRGLPSTLIGKSN
ncbi:MAG: 5-formyltetrahydrofolate cyclo-ligase [Pseudomonadota bacterium]